MKIAIHHTEGTFSTRWIEYCKINGIDYKLVNCYSNNIIKDLNDCNGLLWHHFQTSPRSVLISKQILFALEHSGKRVFPNFNTEWHFDDKVGQKYLLEAIGAPLVPTYIFYDKKEALEWVREVNFPKVFKLRGGAGSSNVKLIKSPSQAKKAIRKAFGRGFTQYNSLEKLKDVYQKYGKGKASRNDILAGFVRTIIPPRYSRIMGRDKGYVYFQDFIKGNDHDIRVVIIDNKAFAIKRLVRRNDFRASGSGNILYDREIFDEELIKLSFELADKLKGQSIAFDFVYDGVSPKLLEISYGFVPEGYDNCPGYWDKSIVWHSGTFNPYGWIIDALVRDLNDR